MNSIQLEDWAETHYELSIAIDRASDMEEPPEMIEEIIKEEGSGGLKSLCFSLTNEFQNRYNCEVWGETKEWNETVENFIEEKIYKNVSKNN